MQIKVSFPGNDDSTTLHITNASHEHKYLSQSNENGEIKISHGEASPKQQGL